jgi:hypothetical protein
MVFAQAGEAGTDFGPTAGDPKSSNPAEGGHEPPMLHLPCDWQG